VNDALEAFPVEVREDGVYVGLVDKQPHLRTVTDVMAELVDQARDSDD
jgi:hypothetical protein